MNMLSRSQEIANLNRELAAKDAKITELTKQVEAGKVELDNLKDQYREEYECVVSELKAQISSLNQINQMTEDYANGQITALQAEAKRLRSLLEDSRKFESYNERLQAPVTPEEVMTVYTNCEVTTTPVFFILKDDRNITWLLRRTDRLRRYTGAVVNMLTPPNYSMLSNDVYLQRALPPGIRSTLEIVFAERRREKEFCFSSPCDRCTNTIIVSFWAEPSSAFSTWSKKNNALILANLPCSKNKEWRFITMALPFPVGRPAVCSDYELDNAEYSVADVDHAADEYCNTLRSACQRAYMQYFFLKPRPSVNTCVESSEMQEKEEGD